MISERLKANLSVFVFFLGFSFFQNFASAQSQNQELGFNEMFTTSQLLFVRSYDTANKGC